MEAFEAKKEEVKKISYQIKLTDKKIDDLVYRMYELSKEEIEIVEAH